MSPTPYTVTKPLLLGPEPWSTHFAFLPAYEASVASPTPQGKEKRREMGKGRVGGEKRRGEERKQGMEKGRKERESFPLNLKSPSNLLTALSDSPLIYVSHIGC